MNPNEEKKVGIPESITINGVTYSVKDTPELQQFIQNVAKVEKTKLYTQIESLKNQINSLGNVQVVGGEQETRVDVDSIVEALKGVFVTKDDFNQQLPQVLTEVVSPLLSATEQNRKDELTQYREKLIGENMATCIPELVKGNTKEELDASLKESIRLRSAYPTPDALRNDQLNNPSSPVKDPLLEAQRKEMEQPAFTPTPQPAVPTPAAPAIPAVPSRPSPEVNGGTNVKQMSMSEFSKRRESLKAELESMYGQ